MKTVTVPHYVELESPSFGIVLVERVQWGEEPHDDRLRVPREFFAEAFFQGRNIPDLLTPEHFEPDEYRKALSFLRAQAGVW